MTALFPEEVITQNGASGVLSKAAEKTIQAKADAGLLGDEHAIQVEMIRQLSKSCDRALQAGKLSIATVQAMGQLQKQIEGLPERDEGASSELDRLIEQMSIEKQLRA